MYFNKITRKRCLCDARNNNMSTFSRTDSHLPRVSGGGRHGSTNRFLPGGRQDRDYSLKRTPSPQRRKFSTDVLGELSSINTHRRETRMVSTPSSGGGIGSFRKTSFDEVFTSTVIQSNSSMGGSAPMAMPLSAAEVVQPQESDPHHQHRMGSSASSSHILFGSTKRQTSYSKVIVMPSVARSSHGLEMSPLPSPPPSPHRRPY